ncbi:hypothetical protein MMC25_002940 [Agyrium rufum]|nr:hypothetical protein [Agyrium rufum]
MDNEAGYDAGEKKELSPSIIHGNSHEDDIAGDSSLRSPRNGVLTRLSWVILCSSMLLAELQAALDSTITADVQPAIIHTFGDIQKLPWVNVTYSLGLGGSCLLWGKLVTLFDSKKVLLVSRVLFAAGSALTAAGPSMNSFIIGKTVTGFGSCGSYISIINIITVFTAPHERGRYFGYIGFVWGLGTM